MTVYLDPRDVEALIDRVGFVIRDRNLLLSALAAPMPVFGEEVYPELAEKAAALMLAVNRDHPLSDGNKRLSWLVAKAFLALNGVDLAVGDVADADRFLRSMAEGSVDRAHLAAWIGARSTAL